MVHFLAKFEDFHKPNANPPYHHYTAFSSHQLLVLHPVNLVLTDIRTEIPITVSIIEVFSRVSIGQCFNFQNYTVFSGACTQNNNTESPNLWLSHLQNGVFSYFISIVIILGPPTKLAQTPLPLEDTIHFGGVRTTIILFSDFPEFVCVGQDCSNMQTQGATTLESIPLMKKI